MTPLERFLMWTGIAGWAGAMFAACYATLKVAYEKVFGKPLPRTLVVKLVELFIELLLNIPGAINKGVQMGGGPPLFLRPDSGSATTTRPISLPAAPETSSPTE